MNSFCRSFVPKCAVSSGMFLRALCGARDRQRKSPCGANSQTLSSMFSSRLSSSEFLFKWLHGCCAVRWQKLLKFDSCGVGFEEFSYGRHGFLLPLVFLPKCWSDSAMFAPASQSKEGYTKPCRVRTPCSKLRKG
jgi:hypothetical protein